jgi:hypothetical protein
MSSITYPEFKAAVARGVERYLHRLSVAIQSGQLRPATGHVFLFPTTLIFTETDTHYAFELLGTRRQNEPLLIKENSKISSFNRVVGGFDSDESTMYLMGTGTSEPTNIHAMYANMTLTAQLHIEQLEERFPGFAALSPKSQFRSLDSFASFMPIDAQCVRTLTINQCYLTSNVGTIIRPRYTKFLFGESNQVENREFMEDLGGQMNIPGDMIMGVLMIPEGHQESLTLAAEFANLYMQDVEETTLTQFLRDHEEVIKRAFGADAAFFEVTLPWREGNPDPSEENIRPDVIIRRHDGSWMIIDFKLPLLDKQRVTTKQRARRKFIYTVNDGISQLFNYADYFNFTANRQAAALTLGEVVSNPQLALVVGSSENVNITEVDEAKRSYKAIDVVDYDTLIRLFLASPPGGSHALGG